MRSVCAALCVFSVALAQSPRPEPPIQLIPRTKEQRDQAYKAEHRVSLIARVTDLADKPVTGLKPEDFTLFDNESPQKFSEFHEVDPTIVATNARLLVVLDGINDGGSAIGPLRKDLDNFLFRGNEPLPVPVSLAFVTDFVEIETSPTTDRASIKSSLAEFVRKSHQIDCISETGASRSYCMAAHYISSIKAVIKIAKRRQNSSGPTLVIWTGRGWPIVAEQKGSTRALLAELNTSLHRGHVVLDAISTNGFLLPKRFPTPLPGPGSSDEDAEPHMTLQALAIESGGEADGSVRNFASAISKLAQPSGLYSMSFDSAPSATIDECHSIRLKVVYPSAVVRTATSYYAQP